MGWVYRYLESLARCYYDKRGLILVLSGLPVFMVLMIVLMIKNHVIPALIKRALNKERPFVVGNGQTVRDFIYVDDLVEGVLKVLINIVSEPINVSDGTPVKIEQLVETILAVCDKSSFNMIHQTDCCPISILDNTKADT